MIKKRLLSVFVVLGVFGLFFVAFAKQAQAASDFCKPDEDLFVGISLAQPALDIRKTVQNMVFSAATDGPMYALSGRNTTQMMGCSYTMLDSTPGFSGLKQVVVDSCGVQTPDPSCAEFTQTYDGKVASLINRTVGKDRTAGSLIGVANYLEGAGMNEPVPVNMAYFWNDSIKNVPFAGTALAADVQYGNAPFIAFVLDIWKLTRNVSYGILSVIMLIVGVSIMLRKKLSPQLVVTAQYALPKVVLAVILITFSYPIGAVLASSMKYLLALTNGLLYDAAASALGGTSLSLAGGVGIGSAALLLLVLILATGGVGSVIVIATVLLLAVAVVLYVFVWIKAFMLYIKLILSIIFAPIAFALGAVPGNEKSTENWIKTAISCVLGYVFSVAYAHMVLVILYIAIAKGFSADTLASGTLGSVILVVFFPVFVVYGFIQATKVPGKINTMIMGEEKRPGGKR